MSRRPHRRPRRRPFTRIAARGCARVRSALGPLAFALERATRVRFQEAADRVRVHVRALRAPWARRRRAEQEKRRLVGRRFGQRAQLANTPDDTVRLSGALEADRRRSVLARLARGRDLRGHGLHRRHRFGLRVVVAALDEHAREGVSLMSLPLHSVVVARSAIGLGAHGKSAPVGSPPTAPRAFLFTTSRSGSPPVDRRARRHCPLRSNLLGERALAIAVGVRQREPRHLAKVLAEGCLVAIAAHEDDLEIEALLLVRLVRLGAAARRRGTRRSARRNTATGASTPPPTGTSGALGVGVEDELAAEDRRLASDATRRFAPLASPPAPPRPSGRRRADRPPSVASISETSGRMPRTLNFFESLSLRSRSAYEQRTRPLLEVLVEGLLVAVPAAEDASKLTASPCRLLRFGELRREASAGRARPPCARARERRRPDERPLLPIRMRARRRSRGPPLVGARRQSCRRYRAARRRTGPQTRSWCVCVCSAAVLSLRTREFSPPPRIPWETSRIFGSTCRTRRTPGAPCAPSARYEPKAAKMGAGAAPLCPSGSIVRRGTDVPAGPSTRSCARRAKAGSGTAFAINLMRRGKAMQAMSAAAGSSRRRPAV